MAKETKIGWCDSTFNAWIGCTKVSQGCAHCYAETQNARWHWVDKWGPEGTRRKTNDAKWEDVLRWNQQEFVECALCGWRGERGTKDQCWCVAEFVEARRRVFVGSLMDVLEDRPELVPWRNDLFGLVSACSNLDFLFLTKRIEKARDLLPMAWWGLREWPENLWMGCTVEDQKSVSRMPYLLALPAPVHFISVEPMLEAVDLKLYPRPWGHTWVICGGESGPGCRPMELEWARDLLRQCRDVGADFFMKQLGGHPNKRHELTDLPDDLRVREWPRVNPMMKTEV